MPLIVQTGHCIRISFFFFFFNFLKFFFKKKGGGGIFDEILVTHIKVSYQNFPERSEENLKRTQYYKEG